MTTTNGEQAPPPARQSRPRRVLATRQERNPTPTSLARTATAAPPRQEKQAQISPFHSHQLLIFQNQGHRMTAEPHDDLDVLLVEDDPGNAPRDMQIALFGATLPTPQHAAAGAHIGGHGLSSTRAATTERDDSSGVWAGRPLAHAATERVRVSACDSLTAHSVRCESMA
jgi:hypothetical protein